MKMNDIFDLERFVAAQKTVYDDVVSELQGGRKRSHWMWFVFPQIRGLGHSDMARQYSISSLDEAIAYLKHPVLGQRLNDCSHLVAQISGRTIEEIFGYPDHMKFHSSMTLFAQAAGGDGIFMQCLHKYFAGEMDHRTLTQLKR